MALDRLHYKLKITGWSNWSFFFFFFEDSRNCPHRIRLKYCTNVFFNYCEEYLKSFAELSILSASPTQLILSTECKLQMAQCHVPQKRLFYKIFCYSKELIKLEMVIYTILECAATLCPFLVLQDTKYLRKLIIFITTSIQT